MKPGKYNTRIVKGATWRRVFVWMTSPSGTPVDLTDYSAKAEIRDAGGTLLFTLADSGSPDGTITLGTTDGTITLNLPAARTETATVSDDNTWDLRLESAGGTVTYLLAGSFAFLDRTTEP